MSMKLDELAERAGVSPRTVRYYIQRGVLPAPDFKGPDTAYDERHLHALRAIKRLQEAYWPLDAIAGTLGGKTEGELRAIAETGPAFGGSPIAEGALPAGPAAPEDKPEAKKTAPEPSHSVRAVRGERITLARGIELWVEDGADRALVDALVNLSHTPETRKPTTRTKGKP